MPPIPVELDVEISSIVDNLHRRQSDLANFQIPRLKDCKENESTRQRYAAEIKEDLDAYGHHIEVDYFSFVGEEAMLIFVFLEP